MPDQPAPPVDWTSLHGDAFRGKKCLVTGAAGFIASHLSDGLLALGATVVALDDFSGGSRDKLPAGCELHEASILDADACKEAADGCELVFHLAAKVSVPASVADPVGYHASDATGTVNVLEAARGAGAKRFMYSASSSAYGDQPTLPKREDMPPMPMSPYAAAKLAGEGYCRAYAATLGLDAVSLRYFNIFGPRQAADSAYAGVIAAFARDLLNGKRPTIYGDGSASRDFTYVANVVHANLLAARHEAPLRGEVFNIGTARRTSVKELAEQMAKAAGREDLPPDHKPPRPGDVPHSLADLTLAKKVLGYERSSTSRRGCGGRWGGTRRCKASQRRLRREHLTHLDEHGIELGRIEASEP